MRILLSLACLTTTACAVDTDTSVTTSPDTGNSAKQNEHNDHHDDDAPAFYTLFGPNQDVIESVKIKNKTCGIRFYSPNAANADTLAFWHVGVDGIRRDLPYPSDSRPNFYAIFVPSNVTLNHTVPGFEAYDHYHVADRESQNSADQFWDAFVVNPGPNYNAATYKVAKSVKDMEQQIAAGILAVPVTTIAAGFGPIVFHGPVSCDIEELAE